MPKHLYQLSAIILFISLTACVSETTNKQTQHQQKKVTEIKRTDLISKGILKDFEGAYYGNETGEFAHVYRNNNDSIILQWITGSDIYQRNNYLMNLENNRLVDKDSRKKIILKINDLKKNSYAIMVDDNEEFEPISTPLQKVDETTTDKESEISNIHIVDFRKEDYTYFIDAHFITSKHDKTRNTDMTVNNNSKIRTIELVFDQYHCFGFETIKSTDRLFQEWKKNKQRKNTNYVIQTIGGKAVSFYENLDG